MNEEKERLITQYCQLLEQHFNRLDMMDGQFDGRVERDNAIRTLMAQEPRSPLLSVLRGAGVPEVIRRPSAEQIHAAARNLFTRLDLNGNGKIDEEEAKGLQAELIAGLITFVCSDNTSA